MASIQDDRGFNQIFIEDPSTIIRLERRADRILSEINQIEGKTILEIGCGKGRMAHYLASKTNMKVLGVDLCEPFIADAQKNYQRPNLSFEVMDFNKPEQIMGRRFDYIVGNGILHHLYYNLDQSLAVIRSLLTEQGKMIFWEPNIYNPYCYLIFTYPKWRKRAFLEPDEMAFSKGFITKKLSEAGYSNVDVQYRDFLLPGIPMALVKPSIVLGNIAEHIPLVKKVAQSIFIQATR